MSYVPNTEADRRAMLDAIGLNDVEELFASIPQTLRQTEVDLPPTLSELELTQEVSALARRNVDLGAHPCFLGAGAYNHYVPAAVDHIVRRSEFYTAYTPYQAEASQGTLQTIYEYQTLLCQLTGMDVANASMYDGATAMAEAALLAVRATHRERVVVAGTVHPEYRAALRTYASGPELTVVEVPPAVSGREGSIAPDQVAAVLDDTVACLIVQHPNFLGCLEPVRQLVDLAHCRGALFVAVVDPISLAVLKPPGAYGADVVVGEGQGLGNHLNYGGPYLGLFATRQALLRQIPGRLVGATTDAHGRRGFVLTVQTREQHIRREKATSNICTNQALNALAAAAYLSLMGRTGLTRVAELSLRHAHQLAERVAAIPGYRLAFATPFFKEFVVRCPAPPRRINQMLWQRGIIGGFELGRAFPALADAMLLCTTERNTEDEMAALLDVFGEVAKNAEGGEANV